MFQVPSVSCLLGSPPSIVARMPWHPKLRQKKRQKRGRFRASQPIATTALTSGRRHVITSCACPCPSSSAARRVAAPACGTKNKHCLMCNTLDETTIKNTADAWISSPWATATCWWRRADTKCRCSCMIGQLAFARSQSTAPTSAQGSSGPTAFDCDSAITRCMISHTCGVCKRLDGCAGGRFRGAAIRHAPD